MLDNIAMTDRAAFAIGAGLYRTAFAFGLLSLFVRKQYSRLAMFTLITGGFLLQTLGMNLRGAEIRGCPLGNTFEIAQFISWSFVLLYFIIGPAFRLRLLGFFTAGLALILAGGSMLVPSWDRAYPPGGLFGGNRGSNSMALAIFSYGVFAILALVSVMFLIQQHGLKKKQFKGVYQYLPSIQQLDQMGKRLLLTGEAVLSASLIFGAVFWIENLDLVPVFKLTATCLVWLGYLSVAILRMQRKLVLAATRLRRYCFFSSPLLRSWAGAVRTWQLPRKFGPTSFRADQSVRIDFGYA